MPFRVNDILLVSSLYDSFILREDGRLNELLINESLELNLHQVPGQRSLRVPHPSRLFARVGISIQVYPKQRNKVFLYSGMPETVAIGRALY